MKEKDITQKVLEDNNDIFADIVNVLLFDGESEVEENELVNTTVHSQYKADDAGRHGGHDLADDQAVEPPLKQERNQAADQAKHKALDHERQADEAIRRTDHLHDGDLFTPTERGQLDGVGHDKQGHRDEDHDQNDGDHAHNVPERDEVFRIIQVRRDIGDAVHVLERGLRVLHERQVVERHDIAVTED